MRVFYLLPAKDLNLNLKLLDTATIEQVQWTPRLELKRRVARRQCEGSTSNINDQIRFFPVQKCSISDKITANFVHALKRKHIK